MPDLLDQIAAEPATNPPSSGDLLDQIASGRQGGTPLGAIPKSGASGIDGRGLTSTATGAFARGAAAGVVPSFAAAGGAAGGAEVGLAIGAAIPVLDATGLSEIGGAAIGALIGGLLGDKAQNEVIKTADPASYQLLQEYQQQDLKDHPVAAALGNLAASLPAFRLGNPVTNAKGAAAIYKIATGKAVTTAEKKLAKNVATQVGLGTAGGVAAPLLQGQTPTAGEITQGIAQTLLFGEPRFGGKVTAGIKDVRAGEPPSPGGTPAALPAGTAGLPSTQNAKGIRADTGQPGETGQVPQESQTGSGGNVQQTSPGQPQPVGAREETQQRGASRGTGGEEGHGTVSGEGNPAAPGPPFGGTPTAPPAGTAGLPPAAGALRDNLVPALLVDGKPITGGATHEEILKNFTSREDVPNEDIERAIIDFGDDGPNGTHGFLYHGEFKTRKEAQKIFEDAGGKVGDPERGLQSQDLIKAARAKIDAQAKVTGSVGAAQAGSDEFSGGNPDIQGVRQPTRVEQAKAGLPVVDQPGTGVNVDQALQEGRTLLGKDPLAADKARADFEKSRQFNYQGFAAIRAKYDMVMANARATEEQFGTDSPEYEAAKNEAYQWSKTTKDMQTEWHKTGQAQQRATDIDTGSVIGLETEFHDQTGRDFTPEQRGEATEKAGKVKAAADETGKAQEQFNGELAKEATRQTMTDPEKAALDAASKTVREAAARQAEAENKARTANQELRTAAQNVQPKAASKAQAEVDKTVRAAAARLAQAKAKERTAQSARDKAAAQVEIIAAQKALDAASKTVRNAAADQARAATKQRVSAQIAKAKAAQVQLKAAQQAHQAAIDRVRAMAADAAKKAANDRVHPEIQAWAKVKTYLDEGMHNFDDIRNRVATDLGLPVKKVTELLTKRKRLKLLADDLWKKQDQLRQFKAQANRWLMQTQLPPLTKALEKIPTGLFKLKVGGHGFVALGTHAPMVGFQPKFWGSYIQDFGKMYQMVGSTAFHEMQMQDLIRRPNYIVGRRAGLVTDPHQYEEYTSPATNSWANSFFSAGTRGYSVLKILRQDMFDQHWDNLPQTLKTPEVAKVLANEVNHATGVIIARVAPKASLGLFAPRLLVSRAAWLVGDPLKAVTTFSNWKNASEADRMFAIHQAKEKAWVMGTMISLLTLNQAFLSATGSKQKINVDDPFKSDWMKFKVAGMDYAYGGQFLTMARLPVQLLRIREKGTGKLKNLIYPDESMYTLAGKYARSQLSPFASLATDILTRGDWQERPLPGSPSPVPKRLAAQGVKPYTWPEFFSEEFAPIPFEEAVREVWRGGFHWDEDGVKKAGKALATVIVMGGTGARLTEDIPDRSTQPPTYPPQWFNQPAAGRNGGVLTESFGTNAP